MEVKEYTDAQFEEIEKIALPILGYIPGKPMSAQPADVVNYARMPEEQRKNWLTGFGLCIEEAKKAAEKGQNPSGGGGGGLLELEQDDGLRHWMPQQDQLQNSGGGGQSQLSNKQYEELPGFEKDEKDPLTFDDFKNSGSSPAQLAADKAQLAADKAQQAADKAQLAADKAQQAADQSGDSGAQQAADKAQLAADKAQLAADKAQQAADKAQQAAQDAQDAKQSGDAQGADLATEKAGKAAQEAGQAAQEAGQAAQEAGQQASQAGQQASQAGQQSGDKSSQNAGQQAESAGQQSSLAGQQAESAGQQSEAMGSAAENYGQQSLSQGGNIQKGNHQDQLLGDPEGDLSLVEIDGDVNDLHFNPTDVFGEDGEDLQLKMDRIASEAGQTLDRADTTNVVDYQKRKYEEVKNMRSKIGHVTGGSKSRGFGNSLEDVFKKIDELFAPVVDWRAALKRMMNARAATEKDDAWSRRRFGVADSHPFHKGRYQHPDEIILPKKAGIMLVFILVDNSGSMYSSTGKGQADPFTNIMSEIINLEKQTHIENSALAYFGAGSIKKEQVRVWHAKDCKNVSALVDYLKQRPGDNGGGTSIANAICSLPELGKKYFDQGSTPSKQTLLICISDGYDDYSDLSKLLTQGMKLKTIFLICNGSDSDLKKTKNTLMDQGIMERHIFLVNSLKEW